MTLDSSLYFVVPSVFCLDQFTLRRGSTTVIDEQFLRDIADNMNAREQRTGDLCPIVIGHTLDKEARGKEEAEGPPLIGYMRRWHLLPFFDTGLLGLAADAWILRSEKERARRFPRRSSEIWIGERTIDPVSFLGATTPCRDLGLLPEVEKLSKSASDSNRVSVVVASTGLFDCAKLNRTSEDTMADEKETKEKPDSGETGESKSLEGKLDMMLKGQQQLIAMMEQFMQALASPEQGAAAEAPPESGAGKGAAGGEGGDDELEALLQALSQGGGGVGGEAPPVRGEDEKPAKQSKSKEILAVEEENAKLRARLDRLDVQEKLNKAIAAGASPDLANDQEFISDLLAMPEEIRERQLAKLSKPKALTASNALSNAIDNAATGAPKDIESASPEEHQKIMKLAKEKGVGFSSMAKQLGFTTRF